MVPIGQMTAIPLLCPARGGVRSRNASAPILDVGAPSSWTRRHEWATAKPGASPPEPAVRRLSAVFVGHCAQRSGGELALARLLHELDVEAHVILANGPTAKLPGQLALAGRTPTPRLQPGEGGKSGLDIYRCVLEAA